MRKSLRERLYNTATAQRNIKLNLITTYKRKENDFIRRKYIIRN